MKNHFIKRIIAGITLLCFMSTQNIFASPAQAASLNTRRAKIGFTDTERFDIPSHLGTIKEIWNPGLRKAQSETPNSAELLSESPSVILIQDAHG
ncbi:MAG: hypothetical protein PHN49_08015, partial [Candidatus Omnitrophica bacterium]|nr:hypothetical protein [Candidatus Omnitrophota bacterium]